MSPGSRAVSSCGGGFELKYWHVTCTFSRGGFWSTPCFQVDAVSASHNLWRFAGCGPLRSMGCLHNLSNVLPFCWPCAKLEIRPGWKSTQPDFVRLGCRVLRRLRAGVATWCPEADPDGRLVSAHGRTRVRCPLNGVGARGVDDQTRRGTLPNERSVHRTCRQDNPRCGPRGLVRHPPHSFAISTGRSWRKWLMSPWTFLAPALWENQEVQVANRPQQFCTASHIVHTLLLHVQIVTAPVASSIGNGSCFLCCFIKQASTIGIREGGKLSCMLFGPSFVFEQCVEERCGCCLLPCSSADVATWRSAPGLVARWIHKTS